MKFTCQSITVLFLITARLLTNDGIMISKKNPRPRLPTKEVSYSIRRPWKRGKRRWVSFRSVTTSLEFTWMA